jgi:hypothetical protein
MNKDGTRQHSKLVAGSAAPLLLDMWYAAIMDVPQYSQTSLSTRDAWLKYPSLPIAGRSNL